MMLYFPLLLVLLRVEFTLSNRNLVLGGIFDQNVEDQAVFTNAVNFLNEESDDVITFSSVTERVEDRGPYGVLLSTCSLFSQQAVAIFGPRNDENIHIAQATCDYKDIPHVITRWVFTPQERSTMINFYPHSTYLTAAYLAVLKTWDWKSFTVFYEDNESILRVAELIRDAKNLGIIVTVKKLDQKGNGNYRIKLKEALLSGETNYVIDCSLEILETVLTHVQQVGMMTSLYNFFITNLDLQTIDLEPFQYGRTNITGIRLFDSDSELVKTKPYLQNVKPSKIKTETALLIDAVSVLAEAILEHGDENLGVKGVNCNSKKTFRHGATISSKVKGGKFKGLTGPIEFDNQGLRNNFNLDVLEVHEEGIRKIGNWNHSKGVRIFRHQAEKTDEDPNSLKNKTFKVITCLTDPYCMLKETPSSLTGNDRFEGFGIDLIHELSLMEGFNYTFLIRADKANGNKNPKTGKWGGMIGDVIDRRADLAITDLTITAEREEAVDFTSPFMNLGISILAKKPSNAPPSFFSFADPFGLDTWIGLALAYGLVTLSFFIIGRMCPDEWTNPYPCVEEPEYLINQFTLRNAAWFAMGALMQQGTEIAPIAISTRMTSGIWWFFVLIMVSSYTASLAAFLATENPINLFSDVQTLVQNIDKYNLKLGAKANGATEGFFKTKEDKTYKAIAEYMATHPKDMVNENKHGVTRAEQDTYAFFMESTSIEYETQRHCELQNYGNLLDDKGYGIAMRKNSRYRKRLSTAILKLQTSGKIDDLKRKWWEEKRGGGQCGATTDSSEASPLHLENLEGVFYVTIGGTAGSVLFVIIEVLLAIYKLKTRTKMTLKEAFQVEIKALMDFNSNVKAVMVSKSDSKSASGESEKGSRQSSNNNVQPAPYGFIPSVTKEDLTDNSS